MVGYPDNDDRTPEEQAEDAAAVFENCGPFTPGTYGALMRNRVMRLLRFTDLLADDSNAAVVPQFARKELALVQRALDEVKQHGANTPRSTT
jgi:hypothetical protein